MADQVFGLPAFRRDQQKFLADALRTYGDIFRMRVLGVPLIMVNHPEYVQRVLVDNRENYDKDALIYRTVRPVLRNGLIGAIGGDAWHRQRRLMQSSFHRPKVALFADNMTEETSRMLARWADRPGTGGVTDVMPDLSYLALRIVTRSLFGAEIGPDTEKIEHDFALANQIMNAYFRFPFPPLSVPTPRNRRLRRLIADLDEFVSGLIAQHYERPDQHTTLLGILADLVDEDTGHRMDAVQLQDEILNIMVGGYETTTSAGSVLLYAMAKYPDVQERTFAEVTDVLDGRVPTFADISRLKYTRMVVDETLRLYSPAYQTMRRAIADDQIGGYHLPAGSGVYINFGLLHRHPEFWPQPDRFDPQRFTPEQVANRPKSAYTPFAAGPRICIGKHFALTELTVIAAMVVQAYRLRLPDGTPPLEIDQLITLRPRNGVRVHLERR